MSITPPVYTPTNLVGPTGIAAGRAVKSSHFATLGQNHNSMWGGYCPVLASCNTRRGGVPSTTAGTYRDLLVLPVMPTSLPRTLTVRVQAKHSGSGVDGHLRAGTSAGTTSVTVPTSATSWDEFTMDVPATTVSDQVILESDSPNVTVTAVTVHRRIDSGSSISDTPSGDWRFWATHEDDSDAPISAEMVNRMLVGPGAVWSQNLAEFATGADFLSGSTSHDWASGEDIAFAGRIGIRGPGKLLIRALLIGTTGHVVQFRIGGQTYELPISATSLGSSYTFQDIETARLQPGEYQLACRVLSTGSGSSRLYSFGVFQAAGE